VDGGALVENSGSKQYRLSAPPQNISWDEDTIRLHAG